MTKPQSTASTVRLSDSQTVILATATAREDGSVLPLPATLKLRGGALDKVIAALAKRDLIAENSGGAEAMTVTDAGRAAIGIAEPSSEGEERSIQGGERGSASKAAEQTDPQAGNPQPAKDKQPTNPPARKTKATVVLDLLERPDGASLDEIMATTGWQRHSVHGFLSGIVKKKLGLVFTSTRGEDGVRRYRIGEQSPGETNAGSAPKDAA